MATGDDGLASDVADDCIPFDVVGNDGLGAVASTVSNGGGDDDDNFYFDSNYFASLKVGDDGDYNLDVEEYASRYSGRTKILRLLFIGHKSTDLTMKVQALQMALDEIKKGEDTKIYRQVAEKIGALLGSEYELDQRWIDDVHRRAKKREEQLHGQLNVREIFRKLMKERVRRGLTDFGDFYYSHGHLTDAFEKYIQSSQYFSTWEHVIQMWLRVILVSIELGQIWNVLYIATEAEEASYSVDDVTLAKLRCAIGLAHLHRKEYKLAAREFLDTGPKLENNYTEVIVPEDVGIYGVLCALASFNRTELKNNVVNSIFLSKTYLMPVMRELINDFFECRCTLLLERLERLKPMLLLDIHLYNHIDTLYTLIRRKAMIQYTSAFSKINLNTLADMFKTSVSGLEKELVALIINNRIQARIDSRDKILYATHVDERNATFQRVLHSGTELVREVNALLLRASLLKHKHN